jgi:hypothetical protein
MNNRKACEVCAYWQQMDDAHSDFIGLCRRYAPRTVKDASDITFRNWPATLSDDWCGEFVDSGRVTERERLERAVAERERANRMIADLDNLGVPLDVSTRKAREMLEQVGHQCSFKTVHSLLKARREAIEHAVEDPFDEHRP